MPYFIFLGAVVLPIVLWLWFIRWQDQSEPEPGKLQRRCFFIALVVFLGAALFEFFLFKVLGLPDSILTLESQSVPIGLTALAVVLVGTIEELSKYLVLRAAVYKSHDFNQIFDGIVYGVTIALGFSFVENITYFIDFYQHESYTFFVFLVVMRGLFTTFAHVTFTGILGYFVGKAKFSSGNRTRLIIQGICYASLLHAAFDFSVVSGAYGFMCGVALVSISSIFFFRIWKKPEVRMIWKYVAAETVSTPSL